MAFLTLTVALLVCGVRLYDGDREIQQHARGGRSSAADARQPADTAIVRLRISGMTCATCPATARLALTRLTGVYGATVTYDDSLGVVRYDAKRVTPAQIIEHLTRLTGYSARVLNDSEARERTP